MFVCSSHLPFTLRPPPAATGWFGGPMSDSSKSKQNRHLARALIGRRRRRLRRRLEACPEHRRGGCPLGRSLLNLVSVAKLVFSARGGIKSVSGAPQFLRGRPDPCDQGKRPAWQRRSAERRLISGRSRTRHCHVRQCLRVNIGVGRSGSDGFRDATLTPCEQCGQAHQIDGQHGCADEHLEALAP